MRKKLFKPLLVLLLLISTVISVYAVDYSLGGYLNGADVNGYNSSWKLTQSGSTYTITKNFSTTDNYLQIFSSDGKKYGPSSYSTAQSVTLTENGGEKVGLVGIPTSTSVTITFNPSTKVLTWSTGGSSEPTVQLKEPYIISVYIENEWDEQYTFTKVAGSTNYEYEVSFEIPNYDPTKEYKFWVGESNAWSNTYSENKKLSDYVTGCTTGSFSAKIYALGENGQPHGSTYKNYGIHDFKCAEPAAKLTLSSNVREFDKADPPTNITLTAQADDKTEGKYFWYKSDDEGATYTKLGETTESSYQLDYTPSNARNYFKVERKRVGSNDNVLAIAVIYTVQSCGENTKGSNIFREDFGELTAVRGAGSRSSFEGVVSGYHYQEAPKKINESFYAVVADPYYCGCGEGSNMDENVTDECLARNYWFRQLRDHTLMNTGDTGPYGGMLLLNFKDKGIAYQRELTAEETHDITKNSILKFSAYFASAAKKDPSFISINMQLIIQFMKTGTTEWVEAKGMDSHVNYDDGWQRAEVEWKVEDADGKFRVVIVNRTDSGNGNDLLVDDISLDLCTPAFALYFTDENGNQTEDKVAENALENSDIQVKKINFGSLGTDPCIQLYQVIKEGNNTSYKYISDMTLGTDSYKTTIKGTDVFSTIPQTVELVAVASIKENGVCNDEIKNKVESGEYTPGAQTNAIFSGNFLTYTIECGTSVLSLKTGEDTNVCYSSDMVMPMLKLTSTNITSSVKMDILVDGTAILTDIPYAQEINISELYKTKNGTNYLPALGERKITVKIKEYYNGAVVCEKIANGVVTVNVMGNSEAPVLNRDGEIYAYNMCKTEGADPSIDDDKFFFNDLVATPTDKSTLVWLTMDGEPLGIDYFYADKVQEGSVKLYNNPAGSCPSDTIEVKYRVKDNTPKPQVNNYKECATEETSKPLADLVANADVYKYLQFFNEAGEQVTEFDPSTVGEETYKIKASLDEINSAANNTCEATAELVVKVKGNATAANIMANDTTVCPGAELILLAKADFAEEQTNVKLTWYSDTTYSRPLAYGETFRYSILDQAYAVSPDTVYVTVQSDDYCENIPLEAKPVVISTKEEVPALAIDKESEEVVVGAIPEFIVSPADARYDLYVNDVKVSQDVTTYKPYIDSEYKLVYDGECGSAAVSAHVIVKWPTVFTPYVVDERNDTFVKDMNPNFKTKIFNRFGGKVAEGDNGWDGTIKNGKLAVPGVYYYVVELPDGNVKKGTIEVFKY